MFGNGANLSLYVGANPVVQRDPSGLFFDFGGLMGGSLVGNDLNSNTLDVGMAFLDAMRGFAGLFETRNAMLSALTGIASTGPNLGGVDAAIEIYNGFQDAQSALLGIGAIRAGARFAIDGVFSYARKTKGHHGIPKFMLGFTRQVLYDAPAHLHAPFHCGLDDALQAAGFPAMNARERAWQRHFRDNPGSQRQAYQILNQYAADFDRTHGTHFWTACNVNYLLGNFEQKYW
jgi:hypothetical protein